MPALAGGYVAYLAHAAVDWDWEMLAVTLAALFCGAGILIAARDEEEPRPMGSRLRATLVGGVLLAMVVAFVGLVGNVSLSRAAGSARDGDFAAAARHARTAHTWAPWSSEPYQQLGEAQLALGEQTAAQRSFCKAIGKSPNDWNIWFDLARATTGKAQADALAQAKRLNPLSPEVAQLEKELASQGQITVGG